MSAVVLGVNTNAPETNSVSLFWTPSPDTNVTGYIIIDGPATGVYTETNTVFGGTITNYMLNTTNLPVFINAEAFDQAGEYSGLANEIWFNGWTFYNITNYVVFGNPSGSNVMCGTDIRHLSTPTNFSELRYTNPPVPVMFFSGYGLTFTNWSTHQTMATPLP
jgi:hypothetical protein